MKTTTDVLANKPFRWNDTVEVDYQGQRWVVPARITRLAGVHLHPSRVRPSLLAKLNPNRVVDPRKLRDYA